MLQGEAAEEAVHQASLGRLRGRITDVLAAKKKPKPDPPAPNFLFFPAKKGSTGATQSVPAEPMIKLLRLLHTITSSLNAVAKKEKVTRVVWSALRQAAHAAPQMMQQEIKKQGATLAKLQPQPEQQRAQPEQQRAQPAVHAALAMSSVSFPSVAPTSELTAHPGDVLQVTCRALPSACCSRRAAVGSLCHRWATRKWCCPPTSVLGSTTSGERCPRRAKSMQRRSSRARGRQVHGSVELDAVQQ